VDKKNDDRKLETTVPHPIRKNSCYHFATYLREQKGVYNIFKAQMIVVAKKYICVATAHQ